VNQAAKGFVDGLFVWEVFGDVRREEHEIGPSAVARKVFAPYTTGQFGKVVLGTKSIAPDPFFSFFLHIVRVRVLWFRVR